MGTPVGEDADARAKFDTVVAPYLGDALAFARWLTRDRADAEDVVQDACLRAYQAIGGFSGGDPRAWVLAIVRNTAFTWMKKHRPAHLVSIEGLNAANKARLDRPETGVASPEADLIARSDAARLEAAIRSLPSEFRESLVLREIQGLSYRQIAEITATPIGTVMSRLARARERVIGSMQDKTP